MPSAELRSHRMIAAIAICAAALLLPVGAARGATATYPVGGGAFAADAEGWQATEAHCSASSLSTCTASGEHDAGGGNPAGSLTARTDADLELLGTFESTVVFRSPQFTVAEAGAATLHLEREFVPGGLIEVGPEVAYSARLVDGTAEGETLLADEQIEGPSGFTGMDAAATVVAGHSYAIEVEVVTGSTAALNLLVEGVSDVRLDNVALSVQAASGGEDGGDGADGSDSGDGYGAIAAAAPRRSLLTRRALLTSVRRSAPPNARLRGKWVFVKARCPRRAGRACRVVLQGRIKRRIRVTQRRAVRIGKGRSRLVGLRVRRRFRDRVAKRRRLLIVQRVRVGRVSATFARSRALIRRR